MKLKIKKSINLFIGEDIVFLHLIIKILNQPKILRNIGCALFGAI